MSTAVMRKEVIPALAMSEAELMLVLRNSLYPGAKDESIKMVIGYCKAAGLDPMQKPVHIVPMYDNKAKVMRDVVMPGVGLYRTQAARTDQYAGVSEPQFGPDVNEIIGGVEITYPQWCKVVVRRRLSDGYVAEFPAIERWRENYAMKGGESKSVAPNAMWSRRPYGQIAKVAEAQALRKAFPELGAQPTADEMEGRSLDDEVATTVIDANTGEVLTKDKKEDKKEELPAYTDTQFAKSLPDWQRWIDADKATPGSIIAKVVSRYRLTQEQADRIRALKKSIPALADAPVGVPVPAAPVAAPADKVVDPFVQQMEAAERQQRSFVDEPGANG